MDVCHQHAKMGSDLLINFLIKKKEKKEQDLLHGTVKKKILVEQL